MCCAIFDRLVCNFVTLPDSGACGLDCMFDELLESFELRLGEARKNQGESLLPTDQRDGYLGTILLQDFAASLVQEGTLGSDGEVV